MEYTCDNEFCKTVDELLMTVRIGDVTNTGIVESSWLRLRSTRACRLHELRLRTALWDWYYAEGNYDQAFQELCKDGVVEQAIAELEGSVEDPEKFLRDHFPQGKHSAPYKYWRQCAMGALAYAYARFQEQQMDYEQRLATIATFLDNCLTPPGYTCNGVRARWHYFRGIFYEANYEMDAASAEYERAVKHLISRAEREIAEPKSPNYETERSFVIYCLGKIELRLAQLDYERGRLTTAKRHAWEAGLLLRSSKDIYLPGAADLLTYRIRRYEPDFVKKGWGLVKEISKHATIANKHTPNRLAASIEHIKTCVYLRHLEAEPPENNLTYLTLANAHAAIDHVIEEASGPAFRRIRFAATLVKSRTLNRLNQWTSALNTVKQAEVILSPLPKPLEAEAYFTRGKILASRGAAAKNIADRDWKQAYQWFRKAEETGHCSVTFRISCQLQMAEALLRMDHVVAASEEVAKAALQLKGVENTFLHSRRARLERSIEHSGTFVSRFEGGSTLVAERDKLGRAYLLHLARRNGVEVQDLLGQYSRLKSPGITRTQLRTLLDRYGRRGERPVPPPHLDD